MRSTPTGRTSRCPRDRCLRTSRAPARTCAAAEPMAVPGRPVPAGAPAELVATELFSVDAYLREFDASVEEVDSTGHRVALRRTAFYPGGGGQPHDLGTLRWSDGAAPVLKAVRRSGGQAVSDQRRTVTVPATKSC